MTDVWLAVIAVAVAVMAAIQVGAIVLGLRLARRVDQLTTQVERDIKPLLQNLTDMTAEAHAGDAAGDRPGRAGRPAVRRPGGLGERTMALAAQFVGGPAQKGLALFAAARAAMSALRDLREASQRRRPREHRVVTPDDEESLFIG